MLGWFAGFLCAVKPKAPEKAPAAGGSSFNQLLGIKGAKQETVSRPLLPPPVILRALDLDVCCIGCLCLDCLANWDSAQSVELHMLQRFPFHDPNTLVYAHATFCLAELVNCFTCFVLCLVNGFVLHLVRLLMQW